MKVPFGPSYWRGFLTPTYHLPFHILSPQPFRIGNCSHYFTSKPGIRDGSPHSSMANTMHVHNFFNI